MSLQFGPAHSGLMINAASSAGAPDAVATTYASGFYTAPDGTPATFGFYQQVGESPSVDDIPLEIDLATERAKAAADQVISPFGPFKAVKNGYKKLGT